MNGNVSVTTTTTTTGAFPNLREISIWNCPKLGALPPHLKSLQDVTVWGECSDELLYSIPDLSAPTHLTFLYLGERSVLFKFGGGNIYYKADGNEITSSSSSSTLAADNNNNINEAQGGAYAASTFQSLQSLKIVGCPKLSCLFDEEKLARGADCLKNLNSLSFQYCSELMISIEQWRNIITHSSSLQILNIERCPKLVPSKVEEAEEVLQLLTSLRQRLGSENILVDILNEGRRIRSRKKCLCM